jgi:DNA-binding MarR family transcriptional regulator
MTITPADETNIISAISSEPKSIKEIADALNLHRRAVGVYLKTMLERKQVKCRMDYNDGREKIYYV